ncbi:hypothetical protein OEV98_08825 [Caldibacillus lycopersici]|uniref:Uncharacterized protein n=1 Tax=Perspicuibacillus lycopersici TaxID=1325689 RepID=A0AAE3LT92_9BACI|nr:hypothetical protein [Perspicuibacillus lycopersici]MCU9613663.1 hypothetical protein [Perspicuibacillus lycopersici]
MSRWLTPEEIQKKREVKKKLFYLSIPILGGILGAVLTILSSTI